MLWVALLVAAIGCGQAPLAPTDLLGPATEYVAQGESMPLATLGSADPVSTLSTWDFAPDTVAQIANGNLIALGLGRGTLTRARSSTSASKTIVVVPNFAGTWKGAYRYTRCERLTGEGSSYCRFAIGNVFPITARFTRRNDRLEGQIDFWSTGAINIIASGTLSGVLSESPQVTLTGTLSGEGYLETIAPWTMASTANGSAQGAIVNNKAFVNAFGPQTAIEELTFSLDRIVQ